MEQTLSGLIASADSGDPKAVDALFGALYDELHRLARRQLARKELTLGTTTLLHEAYLSMAAREGTAFPDRARFMGYAARVMRTLIIDHVRNRKAQKRGGAFEMTPLDGVAVDPAADPGQLVRIGEAVEGLARIDPELAQLVDLRFFCGFSFAEIAALRGASERTVQRHWERARLYLHDALRNAGPP